MDRSSEKLSISRHQEEGKKYPKGTGKGKFRPRTDHNGPERE